MPRTKTPEENCFYNYILCDPRKPLRQEFVTKHGRFTLTHEPFYIGKGTGNRSYHHEQRAKYSTKNHPVTNKIRSIIRSGYDPILKHSKGSYNEAKAFEIEVALIALIGRKDLGAGPLLNLTNGGEGQSGRTHTHIRRTFQDRCRFQQNA